MSRNSSNIISFDGSSRASSRASRDVVESRAARYDESASMRGRDAYASSGRVSSHAVGETLPLAGSIIPNRSIRFQATVSPVANVLDSRKSRALGVSNLSLSRLYDDREASFAANSRVSSRPARLALGIGPKGVEAVRLRFGRFFRHSTILTSSSSATVRPA